MQASVSSCRKAVIAAASVASLIGFFAQPETTYASIWQGGNANWVAANPGWDTVPNAVGAVANHPNSTSSTTTQSIVAGVTVGTISLTNNSNNSWTITNTNGVTMNQDGASAGTATISNTNTTAGTSNFLAIGGTLTLADDLLVSHTGSTTTSNSGGIQITSSIVGSGNVTFSAPVSTVTSNTVFPGTIRLQTGTNTFTGSVLIQKGAVTSNQATAFGNSANAVTIGASGQGSATFFTTNASIIPHNITIGASSGGTITLGALSTGASGYSGTITLNDNVTLTSLSTNAAGSLYSNTISGTGFGITKNGTGTLVMTGTNTYTGATVISDGTLILGAGGTIGSLSPSSSITDDTVLTFNRSNTITQGTDFGTISGLGAVNQNGAGTTVLTATNTYAGATNVAAGKLVVNGSIASNTTVAATASLGGTGTITGTVTLNGTLTPGASAGTLTISGPEVIGSTAVLNYELNGTDTTIGSSINDLVTGVTNLTLDGTLNVTETVAGSFLSAAPLSSWRLINYTGTLTNNTLVLGTMPTLSGGMTFTIDTTTAGQVNLVVVPEPTTLAALGLGLGALLRRRRQ